MPHHVIYGQTESGKTTLAIALINKYIEKGFTCTVFNPLYEPKYMTEGVENFHTPEEFLNHLFGVENGKWKSKKRRVFVDESNIYFETKHPCKYMLATMGRHLGHECHFIGQRHPHIVPNVRNMASSIFLFNCSKKDGKEHAEEWNEEELAECHKLKPGEYFYKRRHRPVEKGKMF